MSDKNVSMNVLVFTENGQRFGLDAAQIAAMVPMQGVEQLDEGFRMPYQGGEVSVVSLAEKIGFKRRVAHRVAKIVLPKINRAQVGFLIGDPEEMVVVTDRDIELLPDLIERTGAGAGIWGIVRHEEELIVLIDLMEAGNLGGAML